jgi:DNA-directed RNA polymerase subunit RPC12/RpoP
MSSHIKFNWIARIGGAIVFLAITLTSLGFLSSVHLISWIIIGIIIAITGALSGGDDMWKCDYCWRKFDNKADCEDHEKTHFQYRCPRCREVFEDKTTAEVHLKNCKHNASDKSKK